MNNKRYTNSKYGNTDKNIFKRRNKMVEKQKKMNNYNNMKGKKGITLIALVITIVLNAFAWS